MLIEYEKQIGESMQQVINRFKQDYNLDLKEKVAFAGRLDPIAFGKIKLLTGEDIKDKDKLSNVLNECNYLSKIVFNELKIEQEDFSDLFLVNEAKTKQFIMNKVANDMVILLKIDMVARPEIAEFKPPEPLPSPLNESPSDF